MAAFTPHVIGQRNKVVVCSTLVVALAGLCQLVALATPGWLCTPDVVLGLFMFCGSFTVELKTDSVYECDIIPMKNTHASLHAVRAMCTISCCLTILAVLLSFWHLWLVVRHEKVNYRIVTACVILMLITVILTVISSIVFSVATKYDMSPDGLYSYDLFYSFALHVVGGAFHLLGAGLMVATVRSLTKLLLV